MFVGKCSQLSDELHFHRVVSLIKPSGGDSDRRVGLFDWPKAHARIRDICCAFYYDRETETSRDEAEECFR
jgi:hypothetical protein